MYFLKSERLGFRTWDERDLSLAQQLWGDPRVTALIAGAMSPEQVAERLHREIAQQRDFGVQYWPVFWRANDEFVGCCGLRPWKEIFELGFHLRPEFWGKGLAEEAGRAVIRYAFEDMKVQELMAGHHPENHASRRVLEKLGFVYDREDVYSPTGLLHPEYRLKRGGTR